MILHLDELSKFISGAVRMEQEASHLRLWRFSRAHITRLSDDTSYLYRAKAASGMKLDFETDSKTLSFSLAAEPAAGVSWFGIDIMVNNQLFHHEYNQDGNLTTNLQLTLPEGQKRVTVYLPNLCSIRIGNFELDDGAFFSPVTPKHKLLFLGDSITQGYTTEHPSRSYVHLLSRAMDAECLNQAIGGAMYDEAQLDDESGYQPDMIFAAYGTNDWSKKKDLIHNADRWYKKLHSIYGNTPVYVLLPIWRPDYALKEATGHEPFLHARSYIKEVCERYPNCHVLDTIDYIPHEESFFHDNVHPNEKGFACYAEAILNALINI